MPARTIRFASLVLFALLVATASTEAQPPAPPTRWGLFVHVRSYLVVCAGIDRWVDEWVEPESGARLVYGGFRSMRSSGFAVVRYHVVPREIRMIEPWACGSTGPVPVEITAEADELEEIHDEAAARARLAERLTTP